jgi:hypothetical protein
MASNTQSLKNLFQFGRSMPRLTASILLATCLLGGCQGQDAADRKVFIGKWQSSRLATPLYLYENSEWEIKQDDGAVLQYGIWEYKNKKIIWSHKIGNRLEHDINPVIMAEPKKFQVRESDQSITSFEKLD